MTRTLLLALAMAGCTGDDPSETGETDTVLPGPVPGEVLASGIFGGVGYDTVTQFAPREDGGFYTVGQYSSLADFFSDEPGGDTLVAEGQADAFFASHAADGTVEWVRTLNSPGAEDVNSARTTPDGGLIACGAAGAGATAATGTEDEVALGTAGSFGGFALRFDADGSLTETWTLTSPSQSTYQMLTYCEVDGQGTAWLGGIADGDARLLHGTTEVWAQTTQDADSFLARTGATSWTTWMAGPGPDLIPSAAKLTDGSFVLAGGFTSGLTVGSGTDAIELTGNSQFEDTVLIRLDTDGSPVWAQGAGAASEDWAWGVAAASDGGFATMGRFADAITLPGSTTTLTATADDAWVARYQASGELDWARQFSGPSNEWFNRAIAFLPDGALVVNGTTGWCGTGGTACANAGGVSTDTIVSLGEPDEVTLTATHGFGEVLTTVYEPDGALRWTQAFHGDNGSFARGVAVESDGTILVGADFSGQSTLGVGESWETSIVAYGGSYDGIWMRVQP